MPEEQGTRVVLCDDSGLSGKNLGDAPCSASNQDQGFCSDTAASPVSIPSARSTKSGPMLLAKTISAEQCKTEPEWVVAGKPPQALEQPTMCSCPPSQGGSREKSS